MENRMDRTPGQSSEDNQSSSSVPSQEQSTRSTTLPEQRLLRRIVWLTLLLGIVTGIGLTLFAEVWYVLAGNIPHAFYPTSPIIYRLLSPLMITSMGFIYIIQGRLKRLRRRHPMFRSSRFDFLDGPPTMGSGLSIGLFFIWAGGLSIVVLWPNLDSNWATPIFFIGVIACLLGFLAEWLIPYLKKRRTIQQRQERGRF